MFNLLDPFELDFPFQDPIIQRARNIPATDPFQGNQVIPGLICNLLRLKDVHLFADHACRGLVLQKVGLDAHSGSSLKPIDAFPAEGLTLKGNKIGDDFVEDRDVVRKPKFQSVAEVVGFLDFALHQKLAFHRSPCIWQDNKHFAFAGLIVRNQFCIVDA